MSATIKLAELLDYPGKKVKIFAKVLSNPDVDEYMVGDDTAQKLLKLDPTFGKSNLLIVGNSIKIFNPKIENGQDYLLADVKTNIFNAPEVTNVVDEFDPDELENSLPLEKTLTLPKLKVNIKIFKNFHILHNNLLYIICGKNVEGKN